MNHPCSLPKQPTADDLVSNCDRLSGGVKNPSVFKNPLQVDSYSSNFWEDEVSNEFVTEEDGKSLELL